ncbi:hypothetical protein C5167_039748 [Papaver somniferum]|uniref:Protein kinase domain-containing protein n=1 Tax=Papaver somniferum TaxID=3469 RepID=A0A4Y7ICZ5_PAPSO|nr:hypothetical protein C5167_039748 [Papaver somniferum]
MEGESPDQGSRGSGTKGVSLSSLGRHCNRKEFLRKFVDSGILTASLEDWFSELSQTSLPKKPVFDVLFELKDLQKFDYALEGVQFQQLIRMPNTVYASTSDAMAATTYLAIEDFLHAGVKGLWETFWNQDGSLPFSVACLHHESFKFYHAEKAIASGKLGGICAMTIILKDTWHPHGKRDQILELALVRPDIRMSSIDRIWNKLGNANWGDIGARQALLATFHCIFQFAGLPKQSIDDLAAARSSHLQFRRAERHVGNGRVNGNGVFRFQQSSVCPEIVELHDESKQVINLEAGSILWLEDSNWQKGFQINEVFSDGELPFYSATPVEEPGKALFLYVGSHPSQLEPALEDMTLWYQVQRQTKILTLMKQNGLASKYLPQLVASGVIIHPGQCRRPSSGANCDHPWCGTPVLVTNPVGELVSELVSDQRFGPDEALRCCHDCLSALSTASSAGIRHGDIRPENVIRVSSGVRHPYYVLIGWGHAIIEERDRPTMNLHFSSTYALQEGKLCSASDAESLIYLLYFSCSGGGLLPKLDSVEGALQWREKAWSRRLIQQKVGEISAILKAFADYVDSLCGTPYTMDYEIWLRRMRTTFHEDHHVKEVVASGKDNPTRLMQLDENFLGLDLSHRETMVGKKELLVALWFTMGRFSSS